MPQVSTSENPAEAQALLRQALGDLEASDTATASLPPEMSDLEDTRFELCGGVMSDDGKWITDFEVRELTGRDEEVLTRTRDDRNFFRIMLELGLVSVGGAPANRSTPDFLLAGDWNTVLLAIRIVTFGREYEYSGTCSEHRGEYKATVDLRKDIPRRRCSRDDLYFTVTGRTGTRYRVGHVLGKTQDGMFKMTDKSAGEVTSYLLSQCVMEIDGTPMIIPAEASKDIRLADRKRIVDQIADRRVGPDLEGVETQCPECGAEQKIEIGIPALFL